MAFGESLAARIRLRVLILVISCVCFSLHGYASDTNVFKAQNSLLGGAFVSPKIQFLSINKDPAKLLGTNAANSILAIAVTGLDCEPAGVQPDVRLVACNPALTQINATLVQFGNILPVYIGANSVVLQATGNGGDGVVAAQLQALIKLTYQPCTTNVQVKPLKIEIDPVGYIQPTGATGGPVLPDTGSLEINSDAANNPQVIIPLSGIGSGAATNCDLTFNPASLNFGSVEVGTNKTLSVQIRNNGDSNCTITVTNITLNGASDYTLSAPAGSVTLAAGISTNFTVDFAPESAVPENTTVIIASSLGNQTIPVAGTGVVVSASCNLSISPPALNFGTVNIGTNAIASLVISNSGSATCTVDAVTLVTTSTSFVVTVPAPSFEVAPGTSQVISVTYTPTTTNNNPQTGTLEIGSSGPNPLTLVSVSGSSSLPQSSAGFAPTNTDFGAVALGTNRTETITITNTGVTNLTITALIISTNSVFTNITSATPPIVIPPGGSTNVVVDFAPVADGVTNDTLFVVQDNPVTTNALGLVGTGVDPTFDCTMNVSTNNLAFGVVGLGQSNTLTVAISNTGSNDCTITALTLTGSSAFSLLAPPLPFPVNVNSDSNVLVTVAYSPTAVTTDTGTLFISSDDPTNPVIAVSLTGSGSQPLLVVTTNALNFGGIPVGSNSTLSVTVSNASAVRATINSIGITAGNANFTLDPSVTTSDVPLSPGAVEQVAVVYTATHQGADSGTLSIVSAGAVTPDLTVSLAGTGLQCNLNFSQSSLGFGSVALGTTNTLTVTISNSGNTNCTVDLVDVFGNGNFKVSAPSTPFSIAAGTNVDVDVEYVPVSSQTIVILGGAVKGSGNPIKITP